MLFERVIRNSFSEAFSKFHFIFQGNQVKYPKKLNMIIFDAIKSLCNEVNHINVEALAFILHILSNYLKVFFQNR